MPQNLLDLYRARVAEGGLTDDPAQIAAIDRLQNILKALGNQKPGLLAWIPAFAGMTSENEIQGLYIHGPVGRGKSMLMDLFYQAVPGSIPKRRVHFHEFMIEVHDFLHRCRQQKKGASNGPDQALLNFVEQLSRTVRVLCFDEFHVTDVADAMILSRLFTALLGRGMVIVATSNWPPEKLYEGGLQRDRFLPFIDLVKARMGVVHLDGGIDYRLRRLERDGVYHWPLGSVSDEWVNAMFHDLTGGAPPHKDQLEVKGRIIPVAQAARNAARFTFTELCQNPLGAEDYLAIARKYHTVFLENVPKLKDSQRNEAKRLMILIDTLYDSGTLLVVTADAPPEKLYAGDDHAFEFQRTVSRLLEMQSKDWLEKAEARD